jgi:outer membrane protein TolC
MSTHSSSHNATNGRHRILAPACIAVLSACAPPTPRIDGVSGAPAGPATPWTVPQAARTPPPPAAPPEAPAVTAALRRDSAAVGGELQLSMADVLDLALHNNPATRESWSTARTAVDQYGSARGALFPSISGNLNASRITASGNGSVVTGLTGTGLTSTGLDTGQTRGVSASSSTSRFLLTPSLSMNYLLFDLGGRAGTIESAKQHAISLDLSHNMTIEDVALQTESALFSFLASRALRDAQIIAVEEAQADTAASEARMRAGVANLEEVLQTRTALAQAKLELATLEGSLVSSRGNLASAMGLPANARFQIPMIPACDSVARVAASVDTIINRAITLRADLAAARADAAGLAAQIRIARAAGYPTLTVSSTSSLPQQLQGGGVYGTTTARSYSVVLGLQIPIFNGFSRQYDVRAARDAYQAGLARVQSTAQLVTVQVFASYAALQSSVDRVNAADDLLRSAQQTSDVALGRYQEGVGTIVDVLLARSALASARASDIQSQWEWRTALAQLAHDAGALELNGRADIPLGSAPIRR